VFGATAGAAGGFLGGDMFGEMFHFLIPLVELLWDTERTEFGHGLSHLVDDAFDLLPFGGGNPFEAQALRFDAMSAIMRFNIW